jgi:hypothetical protein
MIQDGMTQRAEIFTANFLSQRAGQRTTAPVAIPQHLRVEQAKYRALPVILNIRIRQGTQILLVIRYLSALGIILLQNVKVVTEPIIPAGAL